MTGWKDVEEVQDVTLAMDSPLSEDKRQAGLESDGIPVGSPSVSLTSILLHAVRAFFFSHTPEDTKR